MKNAFLEEMQSRGYLNQCTDLDKLNGVCNNQSIVAYIGFAFYFNQDKYWNMKAFAIILIASVVPFGTFYVDKKYLRF